MNEPVVITLGGALLIGLSFGSGPCNISCLPYLGPLFLAEGAQRWRTVALFSAGRLLGYTLLGTLAGAFGLWLTRWFENGPAAWLLGGATVLMGLLLLRGRAAQRCAKPAAPAAEAVVEIQPRGVVESRTGGATLVGMGAAMALNPCVPLSTLLLAAAATADPLQGGALALAFGLGAVLLPSLLFGLLVAQLGSEIRAHLKQWGRPLELGAGLVLIAIGLVTLLGWFTP